MGRRKCRKTTPGHSLAGGKGALRRLPACADRANDVDVLLSGRVVANVVGDLDTASPRFRLIADEAARR
jgi:hypothetical protein